MKPKYTRSKFTRMNFGASLATVFTVCLSASALGADTFWSGTTTDWTTGTNWSLGHTPDRNAGENAIINTLTNSPVVTAGFGGSTPQDVFVGLGAGNTGQLDVTAGTAANAGGNWMFIGVEGGTGTLNITGSGSLNDSGRLWIGGSQNGGGGTGTLTVNTTGTLTTNDFAVGSSGGTGVATISAGSVNTNGWNFIGKRESADNGNGTLNLTGGTMTNNGDRTFIGLGNSTGTFNISGGTYNNTNGGNNRFMAVGVNNNGNANTPVVNVTGGTLNVARRFSAGGMDGGNDNDDGNFIGSGKGSLVVNGASALVNVTGEIWAGQGAGSVGKITLNTGTIQTDSWIAIGRRGGNGTLEMTGGSLNKTGGGAFIIGDGSTGTFTLSGGTVTANDQFWVGQGGGGDATMTMSGGSISNNSWVAIGREGGTAAVNMSGGTWSKTDGGTAFIVGASGPATFTQTNGLVNIIAGETWISEDNTGTYTISGTGELRSTFLQVGRNNGSHGTLNINGGEVRATTLQVAGNGGSNGAVHLNGGILRVDRIIGGGGVDEVDFNGTQIYATSAQTAFISGLDTALLQGGGLKISNTEPNLLSSAQVFTGSGGITKSGAGKLTLTGASSYNGVSAVNEGQLVLSTFITGTGDVTVANGATLGLLQASVDDTMTQTNVTMGTTGSSTLEVNLGNFSGNTLFAPLNVTGTLAVNGTVTVNILDQLPEVGTIPLISYVAKTGSGSFVLGSIPSGVSATLVDDGVGNVYLSVTSVALPYWDGTADNVWDVNSTENWKDIVTGLPEKFINSNPVLFDDFATGTGGTSIQLDSAVLPGGVTFNNSSLAYSINGLGSIDGTTGLLKQGTAALTLGTLNGYTGVTTLSGGTLSVPTLANGGIASPIGMASSSAANLILNGGTLEFTGVTPAAPIDRGMTITADSGLSVVSGTTLTLSGQVVTTSGGLNKKGVGALTLSNVSNSLGTLRVTGGTLSFDGTGGLQTNTSGALLLGNGVTANLPNNTKLSTGDVNIGEGGTTLSTLNLSGNAILTTPNRVLLGLGGGSGKIELAGSSQLIQSGGWMSVGTDGVGSNGTFTVKDNASYNQNGADFNISDTPNSTGTLNLQGSGTIAVGTFFWGKGDNTVGNVNISGGTFTGGVSEVASSSSSTANITQTGGIVTFGSNDRMWFGQGGHATWNQSAGSTTCNGYLVIGRTASSVAVWNVTGGTLTQSPPAPGGYPGVILAESGSGTLTISGGGLVVSNGQQVNLATNGGNGTLNLNSGGTLRANQVIEYNVGTSSVNFDGGTLMANTTANANFMTGIDTVTVKSGGATIDSNGQNIAISQNLLDGTGGGGLRKKGTGTLTLSGTNTYTGNTIVEDGTLSLTAPNLADSSTLTIGLTGGSPAVLNLPNAGTDTVAALVIDGVPQPNGLYDSTNSGGAITGVGKINVGVTPYATWIDGYYTGVTDPLIIGPSADPDHDGQANSIEFALGGNPKSGGDNAKIYTFEQDGSVDVSPGAELLMTIAVRSGTPVNCGTSWTQDGTTYTVQGSADLVTAFAQGMVTQVDPVTTGLGAAPTGYTYRTFSLNGSDGLPNKGFLRVSVAP